MNNARIESEQLKEWYTKFIELFRQEFANLLEIEKTHISKTRDFTLKCQIEVFWLKQPE